jgi:hypothetical protein
MHDPAWVAICCYKSRDIAWNRCADCRLEYGCLGFRSSVELVHFNELIPASMLGEPLPLNLWPNLWKALEACAEENSPKESSPEENSPDELSPVRLLVAALGLECGKSAPG